MVSAFWMIIILGGAVGLCTALSRRRSEEWICFAAMVIMSLLYLFGLCDVLTIGFHIVRILGALAFAASIFLCIRSRDVCQRVLTPGGVMFVFWILVAWWAHRGQMYVTHDEFNHWGFAISRMYALEKLPTTVNGLLDYPSYPPGSTLFCCFYTWLGGTFSEGNTISAANILMLSGMMPLMKDITWKRWKNLLPMALVCVMLPMIFRNTVYQDLYVDVLLGSIASYALIIWFTSEHDRSALFMIGGAMCGLVLVKESGMALVVLCLSVIIIDVSLQHTSQRKRNYVAIALIFLCAFILFAGWKALLSAYGVESEKTFRYWEIATNLKDFLAGTSPNHIKAQYRHLFSHITAYEMISDGHLITPNYVEWLMIIALCACWLKRGRDTDEMSAVRQSRVVYMMMAATVIYLIMLFHIYLYAFNKQEASVMHSINRYMSTIMLPMVAVAVAMVKEKLHRQPPKAIPFSMICLTCMMLVVSPYHLVNLTFGAPYTIEKTQEFRAQSAPGLYTLKQLEAGDEVAWLTEQTDRIDFDYLINEYDFVPFKLSQPCGWHMETVEDAEQASLALAESHCTHAYVFRAGREFISKYGALFENVNDIANTTLYEIIQTESGLKLRKVV